MTNNALLALLGVGAVIAIAASSGTANASAGWTVPGGSTTSNPVIRWTSTLPDGGRVELWEDQGYQVVVATDTAGNTIFTGSVADFTTWSTARYGRSVMGGGAPPGGGSTYVPPPPPPPTGGGVGQPQVIGTYNVAPGVTARHWRLADGRDWWEAVNASGHRLFEGDSTAFQTWLAQQNFAGGGTGGGTPPAPGGGAGQDRVIGQHALPGAVTAQQWQRANGSEWWTVVNDSDRRQIFAGTRDQFQVWYTQWLAANNNTGGGGGGGTGHTGGGGTGGGGGGHTGGGSHSSEPHSRDAIEGYQRILRALQYQIAADGVMGPATRTAIRTFQGAANRERGAHLAVDGILGPQTRDMLRYYMVSGYFDSAGITPSRQSDLRAAVEGTSTFRTSFAGLEGLRSY